MKKILIVVAAAAGAAYVQRKVEQQRSERDLFAAASTGQVAKGDNVTSRDAWAAATDTAP